MKITPNETFIQSNFDKTIVLINKTFGDQHPLMDMIGRELSERYILCPASSRKDYYSAFPGGLAFHNLHMYFWMKRFAELMAPKVYDDKALVTISLLHEIGKVGDEEDYYIPTTSDWHREKGIYYETNSKLQFMKIPDRSLYLAAIYYNKRELKLTQDEYLSILLHDGRNEEYYKYAQPKLATITQFAYLYSTQIERENEVIW